MNLGDCLASSFDTPPLVATPEKGEILSIWPISPVTPHDSSTLDVATNHQSDFLTVEALSESEFLSQPLAQTLRLGPFPSNRGTSEAGAAGPHHQAPITHIPPRVPTPANAPSDFGLQQLLSADPIQSIWSSQGQAVESYAAHNILNQRNSMDMDTNTLHARLMHDSWGSPDSTLYQQRSDSVAAMNKPAARPSADQESLLSFTYSRPGHSSWSGRPGDEFTSHRQLNRQPSEGGARLRADERGDRDRVSAVQQLHMLKMIQQQQQQQQQQLSGLGSSASLGIPGSSNQQQQQQQLHQASFSHAHLQGPLNSLPNRQAGLDDYTSHGQPSSADDRFSMLGQPGSMPYASTLASGSAASSGTGLTSALAMVAAERGLNQAALAMLLQNPMVLDMLTTGTGKQQEHEQQQQQHQHQQQQQQQQHQHQHQQQQQQHMGYAQQYPSSSSSNASRTSSHPLMHRSSDSGRRSGAGAASGPGSGGSGGGAGSSSSMPMGAPPGLSSTQPLGFLASQTQLAAELNTSRGVLVQLILSAFAFLHSDSMRGFLDSLSPISSIYSNMHELPVVQKRQRCADMCALRNLLLQEPGFSQILAAVCALRHHLYSLSRKVLLLNQQGMDAVPIDLLLGGMSSELFHILKGLLPQEVLDFFSSNLPLPKLAVLVFVEFTAVDATTTTA